MLTTEYPEWRNALFTPSARKKCVSTTDVSLLPTRNRVAIQWFQRHVPTQCRLNVRVAPVVHEFQHRHQAAPMPGQAVLHLWRHDRVKLTVNNKIVLQFPQLAGQHLGRDVRDQVGQITEPFGALLAQVLQDDHFPFPPDDRQGQFFFAVVNGRRFGHTLSLEAVLAFRTGATTLRTSIHHCLL